MPQLKMIFNAASTPLPELSVPEDFRLRPVADGELEEYNALRLSVGFKPMDMETYRKYRGKALTDGLLVIEEKSSGRFAASAGAESSDVTESSELGVLGWVMTHPYFKGKHLGRVVSVAAMHRLREAGYRVFSLLTDDFRGPALATYLALGWKPWLYADDMEERWRKIAALFGRDFESLGSYPASPVFPRKES